jgi:hypothetical protein
MMRRLRVQSASLPEGGSDDNPDETIFSDVQQKIRDTSDDPDENGTKGGSGGFAAICKREIADPTGSFTSAA